MEIGLCMEVKEAAKQDFSVVKLPFLSLLLKQGLEMINT